MTLLEAKNKVKKLIDVYSIRGAVTSPSDLNITDYTLKLNALFDIAQKEIATVKHIRKVHKITQLNPTNNVCYDEVLSEGGATSFTGTGKAYYLEISGTASGTAVCGAEEDLIENSTLAYTAHFGEFTESGTIIIELDSGLIYAVRRVGIFDVAVTSYTEYVEYTLPTDYYKGLGISLRGKEVDHYFKGNKLYIAWREHGEILFEYAAMPEITDNTADSYNFEIDAELQDAMCFYVAALLIQNENPSMYAILKSEYEKKMSNADIVKNPLQRSIKRVR
jgi:hypothetical protein